jgi:hypothetical protein
MVCRSVNSFGSGAAASSTSSRSRGLGVTVPFFRVGLSKPPLVFHTALGSPAEPDAQRRAIPQLYPHVSAVVYLPTSAIAAEPHCRAASATPNRAMPPRKPAAGHGPLKAPERVLSKAGFGPRTEARSWIGAGGLVAGVSGYVVPPESPAIRNRCFAKQVRFRMPRPRRMPVNRPAERHSIGQNAPDSG